MRVGEEGGRGEYGAEQGGVNMEERAWKEDNRRGLDEAKGWRKEEGGRMHAGKRWENAGQGGEA
jgi:hypothetical protein